MKNEFINKQIKVHSFIKTATQKEHKNKAIYYLILHSSKALQFNSLMLLSHDNKIVCTNKKKIINFFN